MLGTKTRSSAIAASALGKLRQKDQEFKTRLSYIASSGPSRATLEPVSHKTKQREKKPGIVMS